MKGWIVPIEVRFDSSALVRRPNEDGEQALVSIFVAAADAKGDVSPVVHHTQALTSPTGLNRVVSYRLDLLLRPGAHVISSGIPDEYGLQSGYSRVLVDPAEQARSNDR